MAKRYYYILFFLLLPLTFYGQDIRNSIYKWRDIECKVPICESSYSVSYEYIFADDTISQNRFKDLKVLKIGDEVTYYYSRYAEMCDSVAYNDSKNNKSGSAKWPNYWMKSDQRALREDIYMNYPEKGMLQEVTRIMQEYYYTEEMPSFKWEIVPDSSKEVLGYNCSLARTSFRGRMYDVWFSSELPLPYGPWKFYGLPGLILRVEESTGLFLWNAVEIKKEASSIIIYDSTKNKSIVNMALKKVTREQLSKLKEKVWDDPLTLMLQHGQKFGVSLTPERREASRLPYIPPLEIE